MKRIILLLLVVVSFQSSFGINFNPDLKSLAQSQIKSRFLKDNQPIRYKSNILIRLDGFPTKDDSLIFKELVDTLNVLIAKWDVYLIPKGTSNLIVETNLPHSGNWNNFSQPDHNRFEITKCTVYLDSPEGTDYVSRKKNIYYTILRSLVILQPDQAKASTVPGSVFTETKPENITFHPVDFEIIRELYSMKYENRPTPDYNLRYNLQVIGELVAVLISMIFLILMAQRGVFARHDYDFGKYLIQGICVLTAFVIFVSVFMPFDLLLTLPSVKKVIWKGYGLGITSILLFGVAALVLMYFLEKLLLPKKKNLVMEVMVPLISILFVPVLFLLSFQYLLPGGGVNARPLIIRVTGFCLLLGIARALYIYLDRKSESIIQQKDLELARLNELHKQAELQSLRAKINPHFLYNSLNSIASLASTDARKTEQMALALSDFFKYAINREQKQTNTLSEELNAVRTYLEIEKVRFGERLSFEIDCPDDLQEIQIPQLLIQPLVENAVKHGLSQITGNGQIRITIRQYRGQLKIRVYDNGPAFPDMPISGFGLRNTQERIAMLYGSKASMNWRNGDEKHIEISIPLS